MTDNRGQMTDNRRQMTQGGTPERISGYQEKTKLTLYSK